MNNDHKAAKEWATNAVQYSKDIRTKVLAACYLESTGLAKAIIAAWDAEDDVGGVVIRLRPYIEALRQEVLRRVLEAE